MGLHVGDNPLHVMKNREGLALKMGYETLLFMHQVHKDSVVVVDTKSSTPQCDAMISNAKGLGLCVMAADCIPLLFYDAPTQSIGVAHAGREGTRLQVSSKTVRALQEHFGVQPETLEVYMGPSIRSCCYEVGLESTYGLESVSEKREERYFLDLQKANREELLHLGVREKNITDTAICTYCDTHYFSYRREKITGRFVGAIGL